MINLSLAAMCISEGMAISPWGALGSGKFQSKADLDKRVADGESLRSLTGRTEQTELEVKISSGLEKVATELGTTSVTAVALAYVQKKFPYGLLSFSIYLLALRFLP